MRADLKLDMKASTFGEIRDWRTELRGLTWNGSRALRSDLPQAAKRQIAVHMNVGLSDLLTRALPQASANSVRIKS